MTARWERCTPTIPREALSRCESMITMGGFSLPSRTIREMICASIDVIIQAARLRDGSRRITHITEVMGMEGDTIITQDLFLYDMVGEDANGKIIGRHRSTGIGRPRFWERARYYGEEKRLAAALDAAEVNVRSLRERAMNMQMLALAFLAATAVGGVAWVFLYPMLSGEKKAESPPRLGRKARAGCGAQRRQEPALAPRAGRGIAEGTRGAPPKEQEVPLGTAHHAGRPDLVDAEVLDHFRRAWRRRLLRAGVRWAVAACWRRRPWLRRRLRPAALDPRAF